MKRAPRSRQRHDLYAKYHDYDSEISDLLGECGIKWFSQPEIQQKWWKLGGYSALRAVVEDPSFETSQPYAKPFLDSMAIVKDFWAEPSYASLLQASQKRFHDYVVANQGTAKDALDGLVKDWTAIFDDEGKY